MKRKLPVIIILAIVLAFGSVGCNSLPSFKVEGNQDTDYIVLSNGGSAVQYGNYIYFINGYDGYEDESGKSNLFGKIEKGAVYRAELFGQDTERTFDFSFGSVTKKTFLPVRNPENGLYIKTTTHRILKGYEKDKDDNYLKDENDEYIEIREDVEYADVQRIAPKKVGTSDYPDGGIFIFDDYIFYASPSNRKNREGEVQTQKTDFYRAKLDGSKTELVFTSQNNTSASAYMFYKYADSYYLVVQDGKEVKSIKMDNKIHKPVVIGEGVSDVLFPNKRVYYNGMPENTVEDFIYIIREPIDSDPTRLGNVLEAKRPDGSSSYVIAANGSTVNIIGADNGVLFYKSNDTIKYTNLAELTNGQEDAKRIAGSFDFSAKRYTNIRCINPNPKNLDDVYLIAMSSSGLYILDRLGNERQLHDKESTFVYAEGNYLYFTSGFDKNSSTVNMLARIDMFLDGVTVETILNTDDVSKEPTFTYDILPDFVVYFSDIDSDAKEYTFFKELDDLSAQGVFVGLRTQEDTIPEEDLYPDEDEEDDSEEDNE